MTTDPDPDVDIEVTTPTGILYAVIAVIDGDDGATV
jgi:hypothetical protein